MRFHVNSRPRFSFNGSKFMYFFVLRKYFHHVFVLNKRPFVYYYQKSTLVLYTDITKSGLVNRTRPHIFLPYSKLREAKGRLS